MNQFLWGALFVAAWTIGLFFLKFWRRTGDRLFIFFCFAFWALAAHWLGLGLINPATETRHYLFLLRLVAFVLIIVAIVDKNRRR
jgi:hypothetical protein